MQKNQNYFGFQNQNQNFGAALSKGEECRRHSSFGLRSPSRNYSAASSSNDLLIGFAER
jgi:hypothetical protein